MAAQNVFSLPCHGRIVFSLLRREYGHYFFKIIHLASLAEAAQYRHACGELEVKFALLSSHGRLGLSFNSTVSFLAATGSANPSESDYYRHGVLCFKLPSHRTSE